MRLRLIVGAVVCSVFVATSAGAQPPEDTPAANRAAAETPALPPQARAADHWTPERIAAAIPRDLVVDERGLGYLRHPDGSLHPHGHGIPAERGGPGATPEPMGKPGGGGGGTTGSAYITDLNPAHSQVLTTGSYVFSANVALPLGERSVSFVLSRSGQPSQTFSASSSNGTAYQVSLSGLTNGSWSWQVVAKDNGKRGGTTHSSAVTPFSVSIAGGSSTVTNAAYTGGGPVQNAAGRIYFEMPDPQASDGWSGYVCSGTVATDNTSNRSVIITAAHCVFDDVAKVFADRVIFIPNQDATTAGGTDRTCGNDPLGCWDTLYGVVDVNWTTRTFPANIPWDYAYYVVSDTGAHSAGYTSGTADTLDVAAGSLPVQFTAPTTGAYTHALGYSYNADPNFMYCAQGLGTEGTANWWLGSCGLSGGSSGGPWVQPLSGGTGPIISVNSWGYARSPGMAGPRLHDNSAACLFTVAKRGSTTEPRGAVVDDANGCPVA